MTAVEQNMMQSNLLAGKRGLIMGVANDKSIAWGMSQALAAHGADLAFTYQGPPFLKRVEPLARSIGTEWLLPCDVTSEFELDTVFDTLGKAWGGLDFVLHAMAFSDKEQLKGRYVDTTLDNFLRTMQISSFSFTQVAQRAAPLMKDGGSLLTLSYLGAEKVMPSYNVMGVAKAALECSVRYLANDLGPQGVRVNAVSAGPVRTIAGASIGGARTVLRHSRENAPLRRSVGLDELGGTAVYLFSDLSSAVTGEIHHVDCGYNVIGMPHIQNSEPKD